MTLPPTDQEVRSVPGPIYKVGPVCSHCHKYAEHPHHLWRSSRQGGQTDWIEINGKVVGNKTGLCWDCHRLVTGDVGGYKAAIRWIDGAYVWCIPISVDSQIVGYIPEEPLDPQPPTPESLVDDPSRASGTSPASDACPFCGQAKRRRSFPPGFGRRRKSWRILVPDDQEDGATILDTLVDDLGLVLGVEPGGTGRYYIILPCVYYAHQEKARFVESIQGIGG